MRAVAGITFKLRRHSGIITVRGAVLFEKKKKRENIVGKQISKEISTDGSAKKSIRVLACDTSSASCSCCIVEGGRPIAVSFLSLGRKHSQTFMPMVHDLMLRSEVRYEDLDFFACTVGPGSFTGIRIGVGAVQAMAFAAGKPAVPVSSLKALAFPLFDRSEALVAAMIDARNARVFSAAYFNGAEVVPEAARTIDEFVALCDGWREANAPGSPIITCGNACEMFAAGTGGAKEADRTDVRAMTAFTGIDPRAVAAIGEEVFLESDETERDRIFIPEALLPVYLARTAAERNLDNKL